MTFIKGKPVRLNFRKEEKQKEKNNKKEDARGIYSDVAPFHDSRDLKFMSVQPCPSTGANAIGKKKRKNAKKQAREENMRV